MSDTPAAPKRRAPHGAAAGSDASGEAATATDIPALPETPALSAEPAAALDEPRPIEPFGPSRRAGGKLIGVVVAGLLLLAALATTPFWAPPVMQLLPWGEPAVATNPVVPAPAPSKPAVAAPDPELATIRAQAAQNVASVQQLGQRIAALEAKPVPVPPDLAPIQQQLAALTKANADLNASVTALQKAAQNQPATADPRNTALALVLLQIREAVDLARPFEPEYQTLLLLAREHPEIAAAAQPLAGPAASGVASRAALATRLRELAPKIATARAPPSSGWKAQIVARLRALVTIRRIEGEAQTPAEAAVSTAQRDMAGGDLSGAVEALAGLSGPARDAAEPWSQMARQRLAVETSLRRVEAAVTAALATPAPGKG